MTIGSKIKELRRKNNLTQKQLADILFVSDKMISRWESEKNIPDMEMMNKLCEYFNISFDDFFDKRNTPKIYEDAKVDINFLNKYRLITIINISIMTFCFILRNFVTLLFRESILGLYIPIDFYFLFESFNYIDNYGLFYDIFMSVIFLVTLLIIIIQVSSLIYFNNRFDLILNNEVHKKIMKRYTSYFIYSITFIMIETLITIIIAKLTHSY